jgi:uncharacterized protein (DUF58 family)
MGPAPIKKGLPIIGLIFFALGMYKLVMGGTWVVWFILAFLFGAFSAVGVARSRRDR